MNETRTFEVTSGKIIVTDPCYEFDEENVIPAKNGTWTMSVNTNNQGVIAELIVLHSDYYKVGAVERILDMTCPVDSGQAGVFDADLYSKYQGGEYDDMESFYGRACHLTCETKEQNGVVIMGGTAIGAVSSSGYGDGNYEVAGFYDGDELYGIRVYFDNYSEDEDDEDAYEEDTYYRYW